MESRPSAVLGFSARARLLEAYRRFGGAPSQAPTQQRMRRDVDLLPGGATNMAAVDALLLEYARAHDPQVREDIVLACIGLVKHVVARMPFVDLPGAEYSDLVSHGIVGLMYAIDRYDAGKGVKFETYAVSRIRGSVIDALRKQNWMPRDLPRKMRVLESASSKLEAVLKRHPTDDEIADELGMPRPDFDTMMQEISRASMVSLDSVMRIERTDDSVPLAEVLSDPDTGNPADTLDAAEGKRLLVAALDCLQERDKLVLSLYYYEELTLKEIGAVLGVSESRVCQLHTRAIASLRTKLKEMQYGPM